MTANTIQFPFRKNLESEICLKPTIELNFQIINVFLKCFDRISLALDDKEVGTTRLARGTKDIDAPTAGGLYLGGLRKSCFQMNSIHIFL